MIGVDELGRTGASPQNVVRQLLDGPMGPGVAEEGVTEAARRLSHALAEIAAQLDTEYRSATQCRQTRRRLAEAAKNTVRQWGVL